MRQEIGPAFLHDDRFWGVALIALGLIAISFKPFEALDRVITGKTDTVLTTVLLLMAIGVVIVAFAGRPALKALLIVWIVTP